MDFSFKITVTFGTKPNTSQQYGNSFIIPNHFLKSPVGLKIFLHTYFLYILVKRFWFQETQSNMRETGKFIYI